MQRMRTWRQRVHRTTPVALLAILLQVGNALAMTVPASGSFAADRGHGVAAVAEQGGDPLGPQAGEAQRR